MRLRDCATACSLKKIRDLKRKSRKQSAHSRQNRLTTLSTTVIQRRLPLLYGRCCPEGDNLENTSCFLIAILRAIDMGLNECAKRQPRRGHKNRKKSVHQDATR